METEELDEPIQVGEERRKMKKKLSRR